MILINVFFNSVKFAINGILEFVKDSTEGWDDLSQPWKGIRALTFIPLVFLSGFLVVFCILAPIASVFIENEMVKNVTFYFSLFLINVWLMNLMSFLLADKNCN